MQVAGLLDAQVGFALFDAWFRGSRPTMPGPARPASAPATVAVRPLILDSSGEQDDSVGHGGSLAHVILESVRREVVIVAMVLGGCRSILGLEDPVIASDGAPADQTISGRRPAIRARD